jgi:hypothetical protein
MINIQKIMFISLRRNVRNVRLLWEIIENIFKYDKRAGDLCPTLLYILDDQGNCPFSHRPEYFFASVREKLRRYPASIHLASTQIGINDLAAPRFGNEMFCCRWIEHDFAIGMKLEHGGRDVYGDGSVERCGDDFRFAPPIGS